MLSEIKAQIRVIAIKALGVHIVAEWEEGSSDAVDLPIYDVAEMLKRFPQMSNADAKAFFTGKCDGMIVRRWIDDQGRKAVDKAYFPCDEVDNEMSISTGDVEITLMFDEITVDEILRKPPKLDIEKRLEAMPANELHKLLGSLSFSLSSLDVGEAEVFKLLAEIEASAIKVEKARKGESQ